MANSPNTGFTVVSKTHLEQQFDAVWDTILRHLITQSHSSPAAKSLGLPRGAVTFISTFKQDGKVVAITYRHATALGLTIGSREHNPTYMLIDGQRYYAAANPDCESPQSQ